MKDSGRVYTGCCPSPILVSLPCFDTETHLDNLLVILTADTAKIIA
jgi:hypothetical protein